MLHSHWVSPDRPCGPRDGAAHWAMLTEQGETLASYAQRGAVRTGSLQGPEHLPPKRLAHL